MHLSLLVEPHDTWNKVLVGITWSDLDSAPLEKVYNDLTDAGVTDVYITRFRNKGHLSIFILYYLVLSVQAAVLKVKL